MDIENNSQVLGHELAMHVGCMVVSIPLGIKSSKPYQKKLALTPNLHINIELAQESGSRSFFNKYYT